MTENIFFKQLLKHANANGVIWDKQLICPRCHHRSMIHFNVYGGTVPPTCLHCGFKLNPRTAASLRHHILKTGA